MYRPIVPILVLALASCDDLKGSVDECTDVCTIVSDCDANPPDATVGNYTTDNAPGEVDCAVNCVQDDRARYGYSDCQIECILDASCDEVQDCWKANSDRYAEYCLADRDTVPIEPDKGDEPDNGTTTGNSDADEITEDPAVEIAVEDGDYEINYGDDPPDITGLYDVYGSIDDASNARPVGSIIDTTICFSNQSELTGGTWVDYCEYGVPGTPSAPVTGSGDQFTVYLEYEDIATVLFSGTVGSDGKITEAEALVVYLYGVDVWEHSVTAWTWEGECSSCE